MADLCMACGSRSCPGRAAVDYCPRWQEAEACHAHGEYLTTRPANLLPVCTADDVTGEECFRLAQWVWRPPGEHQLYLCNFHADPFQPLMPSADVPACRDEDPAQPGTLAACYPDPPEYQHPEDDDG